MASLKFFIKTDINPATIYVRFKQGSKFDLTKSTSLLVNPKYWNNKKGIVRQIAEFTDKTNLQNDLNDLNAYILNSFNDHFKNGGLINANWLQTTINDHFNRSENTDYNYFIDFATYYKSNLKNKVLNTGKTGVTQNTLKRYNTIINKVKEFELYKKKKLLFSEIDLKFYQDFKHFLVEVQNLNLNTTGRYINYIKTICLNAKKYGIKINPDIEKDEFRATKEDVSFVTLSEREIDKIFKHDFSQTPYLDNARNWLIIGVWTGARVSDLLRFNKKNIENGFIEYTSQKTGQKVVLPLHAQVKSILERLNGEFPKPISSQKYNDYIKTVCEKVGLKEKVTGAKRKKVKDKVWRKVKDKFEKWELVSTHICRRSFATNHYGKLPTPVIMAVTGHKTEKMFLKYIGKTSKDNAEVLQKFWQDQEQKRKRKPKLDIIKTETA